jgi:hypothetical protein
MIATHPLELASVSPSQLLEQILACPGREITTP